MSDERISPQEFGEMRGTIQSIKESLDELREEIKRFYEKNAQEMRQQEKDTKDLTSDLSKRIDVLETWRTALVYSVLILAPAISWTIVPLLKFTLQGFVSEP